MDTQPITFLNAPETDTDWLVCTHEGIGHHDITLLLDPEERALWVSVTHPSNRGYSPAEWHGRHRTWMLHADHDAVRLTALLTTDPAWIAVIDRICAGYEEKLNDQANRVGTLTDDAVQAEEELQALIDTHARSEKLCMTFSDFLYDDPHVLSDVTDEALEAYADQCEADALEMDPPIILFDRRNQRWREYLIERSTTEGVTHE